MQRKLPFFTINVHDSTRFHTLFVTPELEGPQTALGRMLVARLSRGALLIKSRVKKWRRGRWATRNLSIRLGLGASYVNPRFPLALTVTQARSSGGRPTSGQSVSLYAERRRAVRGKSPAGLRPKGVVAGPLRTRLSVPSVVRLFPGEARSRRRTLTRSRRTA